MISGHFHPVTTESPEPKKDAVMSKWVIGYAIAAIICGIGLAACYDNIVVPVNISRGTPDQNKIYALGWFSLALTGLGTAGFSTATLIPVLQWIRTAIVNYWPQRGVNGNPLTKRDNVLAVFDIGKLPLLANAYNATTDINAKSRMYDALKLEYDAAFERQIPKPANYISLEPATSVMK